jgi:Arc/MetJ-type ribon-helix-helix transcriptional regulator
MAGMVVFTVHMPPEYVEALQQLVDAGFYHSISDAIRTAVRDLIMKESPLVWRRRPMLETRAPDGELVVQPFNMPRLDYNVLSALKRKGYYASISEAVREATHELIRLEKGLFNGNRSSKGPHVEFNTHLPRRDHETLKSLVRAGTHTSMSEGIRFAVRLRVIQEADLL